MAEGGVMDLGKTVALAKKRQWQPIKEWFAQATPEAAYERLKCLAYRISPADVQLPTATSDQFEAVLQSALLYFLGVRARGGRLPNKMNDRQNFNYAYGIWAAHKGLVACVLGSF